MAADMLINVLTHPEAWLKSGGVSKRKLIPVLGAEEAVSLDQALELSRNASLWMSKAGSDLARQAARHGATVLDASHARFGPLITRLPGIIDLDEIATLQPIAHENIPPGRKHVAPLVKAVNHVLRQAGLPDQTVMLAAGSEGTPIRDVDLTRLGLPRVSRWPTRFISVKMDWPTLLDCADLHNREPRLATFLVVDILLGKSVLLHPYQERIRELAGRFAVEGVA